MSQHPFASYWDKGVRNVPDMTGAKAVLDCHDLTGDILPGLGIALPLGSVLDYGCGTGRVAQLATSYIGFDITPSMVEYATGKGLEAYLISKPSDCWPHVLRRYDLVTCISVCTHVDAPERLELLRAFREWGVRLLVDIIPGDGSGGVAMWTADPGQFEAQLDEAGWKVLAVHGHDWRATWETTSHRYYHCEVK